MALSAQHLADLRYRRALSAAYGHRRRPRAKMPEQRWPRAARLAYFAALKAVVAGLHAEIDRVLIPQLPRLLALVQANKPGPLRIDSADDLKAELDKIKAAADQALTEGRAKQVAQAAGQQVAAFNKAELNKQFRASVGIELLHGEPYLQQQLALFADDNARLITSLADDHLDQVSGIVMRAARAGTSVEQVQRQIAERFDVTESKAELLARDQVGKLNGELTQLRQQSVGVTEYEWSTSRDERVRSRHAELEGTTHSWDDPPVVDEKTGRRAHPGQDFQCRCTALPKVDAILDALASEGTRVQPEPSAPPRPSKPTARSFPPGGAPFTLPDTPQTALTGQPYLLPESLAPQAAKAPSVRVPAPQPAVAPPFVLPDSNHELREPTIPPAPAVSAAPREVPRWMREAKVIADRAAGSGVNAARVFTLETSDGPQQAVWKSGANEVGVRRGVKAGSYHQREAAMHDLDRALGGEPIVPSTVVREIDGIKGSLQAYSPGVPTYQLRETLESIPVEQIAKEPSVRRTFLLDVISANDDRHGENALWRRKPDGTLEVVPIDHGLVFPQGSPSRFLFLRADEEFQRAMMKLDETSKKQLQSLSLPKVASILHEQPGITTRQVRETLARIRSLQIDPEQLERLGENARLPKNKWPTRNMQQWLGKTPEARGLSAEDLAEIDRLSEKPQ